MPSLMCMPWTCNRQVDSLDRRQCNLQQIPGDLERYARSLEELLLDMNHIRELPKSLFRLQKLQRLGLSDNDIHRLPPEVSALENLIELNLSRNDISDLPEDLKICQHLQLLDISSNPIARLPDSITLCTSLTQLALNDISLTKLPQDVGKLVLLKSLEARENHLRSLPPSIAELTQLQRLDLGQNELDDLPNEIGSLRALQELYVDENSLERLPDAILRCTRLEQLDASSNRLFELPEELGDLTSLVDLTVSHNCIRELPSSMGRLKRLFILKADDNTIDSLTPAIGGCTALNELYLQQNLIAELPSSIGNLRWLQTLNLDRCQLRRLPALIGECQSMTVLSVRDNQLDELPMEIGKLARLRVLDCCNNRISSLPYTINVLRELQALWLSENQSQALLRLQPETDSRSGIKVLTCYLLPQQDAANKANGNGASSGQQESANKAAFVGGPKVHFGATDNEEAGTSGGTTGKAVAIQQQQFERKNTPHPKPSVGSGSATAGAAAATAKHHKKQQVDGHVAPRMGEHPKSIVLSGSAKKISQDHSSAHSIEPRGSITALPGQPQPLPRSALKYSSRAVIQQQQGKAEPAAFVASTSSAANSRSTPQQQPKQPIEQTQQKTVFFANQSDQSGPVTESPGECRLKRVNTPHYKSQRATAGQQQQQQQNRRQLPKTPDQQPPAPSTKFPSQPESSGAQPPQIDGMHVQDPSADKQRNNASSAAAIVSNSNARPESPPIMERKRVLVLRDLCAGGGLGLSIAGGIESTPFIDNDSGLFISKLTPSGAAERAGLRVGDKVIEINGTSMLGQRHQIAVDCIQQRADGVELFIQRWANNRPALGEQQRNQQQQSTMASSTSLQKMNISSTALPTPSLPVSSSHPPANSSSIPSASMTPNSSSVRPTTPSQLTNTSFSSLPAAGSTPQQQKQKAPYAADLSFGDTQLDGTIEQVELVRDSKNSLGLSIVGGIDHCSHPFGSSAHPGVFVSKIATNSPAEMSRRLRIGDRILKVNDLDIVEAKHNEAVEALRKTNRSLRLTVCHEPQPKGLRSVVIHRRDQQPLGLSICGGIGSTPANPHDTTDEGIFIERVEREGPADHSCVGLTIGMRILEVNDDSLLGCTKEEAAQVFRRASPGPVRLLVCDGFSPLTATRPSLNSVTIATSPTMAANNQQPRTTTPLSPPNSTAGVGLVNSPPPPNAASIGQHQNGGKSNHNNTGNNNEYQNLLVKDPLEEHSPPVKAEGRILTEQQAAGSVPALLTRTNSIERNGVTTFSTNKGTSGKTATLNGSNSNNKIPPPVAPKPKINITSFSNKSTSDQQQYTNINGSAETKAENATNFSTRLLQFEQQKQQSQQQHQLNNQIPPAPPSKRPLLSAEDLAKLAEDDRMRQQKRKGEAADGGARENGGSNAVLEGISPMSPPKGISHQGTAERQNQPIFEHILNDSPTPLSQPMLSSIRTKKAENRFLLQQQQQQDFSSSQPQPSSTIDQLAKEQQRRSEWRRARMASLEADVNEISKLKLLEEPQHQQSQQQASAVGIDFADDEEAKR